MLSAKCQNISARAASIFTTLFLIQFTSKKCNNNSLGRFFKHLQILTTKLHKRLLSSSSRNAQALFVQNKPGDTTSAAGQAAVREVNSYNT